VPSSPIGSERVQLLVRERGGPRHQGFVLEGDRLREAAVAEDEADVVIEVATWGAEVASALRDGNIRIVRGSGVLLERAKVLRKISEVNQER